MRKSRLMGAVCACLFSIITVSSNATLLGRLPLTPGGTDYQAAYDDVLNITWLTDADLSGSDTWANQVAWVDSLNTSNHLGFSTGWRLASMSVSAGLPIGTTYNTFYCSTPMTESACRDNELGYMFYHNTGGTPDDNKTGNQTVDGVLLTDVLPFYWSDTEYDTFNAWLFAYFNGAKLFNSKSINGPGWAVRNGDIPLPPSLWLFVTGLLGLIGMARRKNIA